MTAHVPNRGMEGEGTALVANAQKLLQAALNKPGLGAETKVGAAIVKALQALGKAVADGAVSPGMENAGMQQWLVQQRQQGPQQNIMAMLGHGGGAPPGGPPGGGAPPPGGPVPAM